MRKIFQIYFTDIKRIVTNWAAFIIIVALIALPSLYAWFNIKASWDPYGNTKDIPVAITNQDAGYTVRGEQINVGKTIVESLRKNKKLGWKFVNEEDAIDGVKHGDYYASILIPKNFSEKITSIINENPEKPIITYTVNEKINAIAPKITSSGATGIVQEISGNFVKTVSETIFSLLHELGIEIERELPNIENMRNFIFKLENEIPEINRVVNTALTDINKAQEIEQKVKTYLPLVEKIATDGEKFSKELSGFVQKNQEAIKNIIPTIKGKLAAIDQSVSTALQVKELLQNYQNNPEGINVELTKINTKLNNSISMLNEVISILKQVDAQSTQHRLSNKIAELNQIKTALQTEVNLNNQVIASKAASQDVINRINNQAQLASSKIHDVVNHFDTNAIQASVKEGINVLATANHAFEDARKSLPDVKKIMSDASKGIVVGKQTIEAVKKDLPTAEAKIKEIANRIREFEKKANLHEIIKLLKHNVERESDFLKTPVLLKEQKLFPIPNYGSGMSPFFSTLSFWVGAMLLISLLSVDVHNDEKMMSYQIYFGRLFTFLTLAILQSIIVTLGDMYLLHTYVVDKAWFVLFGVINSAVFMIIVYTMVSVFGNVGKALGIILLVLQISGSGGTFPIQVAPRFFQIINPFLPFTYSISLMREAAGGILWDIVLNDVLKLVIFLLASLLIGITLKKIINKISKRMIDKAKESKLIH